MASPTPAPPRLSQGKIGIAASQGRIFTVIGGVLAVALVVIYALFSGKEEKKTEEIVLQQAPSPSKNVAPPPDLPDEPAPPPPIIFDNANISPPPPEIDFEIEEAPIDQATANSLAQRLKSPIMVLSGSPRNSVATGENKEDISGFLAGSDGNVSFAKNSMQQSFASTVVSTRIKNMRTTIAQGKIINAVLETAINTQLPGNIRAIISRDVYAEQGKNILIPKGSRVIGAYNTALILGQNRVFIIWNRIIRPDGIDVMINSPGVDNLGRAGINGFIDTRFGEMLSAATLSSVLGLGLAVVSQQIDGSDDQQQQVTQGSGGGGAFTTTQASTPQQAASQGAQRIGEIGGKVASQLLDVRPRITIDQGTPVSIFVQNDLIFPDDIAGGSRVIP
jgi:type IV secretion system protein VirB10